MKYFIETKDKRNQILKQLLLNTKKEAFEINELPAEKKDVYIFSPAKKWTKEEADNLTQSTTVFCGNTTDEIKQIFQQKNITYINLLEDEVFAYKNAWLTAEGTLAEILINSQKSLFENTYLLLGFGRCSKTLGLLFNKLGISYDVAVSNEKRWQEAHVFAKKCYLGSEFLNHLNNYDVVINSVPLKVFEDSSLSKFKKGAILLEIASVKCINHEAPRNFEYIPAPALPQKYTSKSAAKLMFEKIKKELNK